MSNTIGWGKGAQNNSIGWGNVGTNGFGSIYERSRSGDTLLSYTNPFQDATVAYSLRDLNLGVTSNVVRVRRSSDNLEQDFTATQVTDGTLTSFCGAGNGFVSVWYDQKGQFDFAQTTALRQPRVVSLGILNTLFGKPVMKSESLACRFTSSLSLNESSTVFSVIQSKNVNIFISEDAATYLLPSEENGTTTDIKNNLGIINFLKNNQNFNPVDRGEVFTNFVNGGLLTAFGDFSNINNLYLGYNGGGSFGIYNTSEFIVFKENVDNFKINNEINDHYGIY